METVLKAIADPTRRRILELVTDQELTAGEIAAHFAVTRPAISQHLAVLKEADLLSERRQGTSRRYRIRPEGFAAVRSLLEGFWDDRLGRLRHAAEQHAVSTGEVSERLSVQRAMIITAPPETVWDLLTLAERQTRWMGQSATFELSPGGEYRVEVLPNQFVAGEFLEIDPPHRLSHTWGWEVDGHPVDPGSTLVSYELMPTDSGTLLRLTHRHLPTVHSAGTHSRGWGHYLERLAAVAAGGRPGPDPWASDPDRLQAELRP